MCQYWGRLRAQCHRGDLCSGRRPRGPGPTGRSTVSEGPSACRTLPSRRASQRRLGRHRWMAYLIIRRLNLARTHHRDTVPISTSRMSWDICRRLPYAAPSSGTTFACSAHFTVHRRNVCNADALLHARQHFEPNCYWPAVSGPLQWGCAAFHCTSITAWARTGNVPIPAIFGGAAKNMKPSFGRLSRLVMCSTMGMPASSSVE